jgi:hypothetical protein
MTRLTRLVLAVIAGFVSRAILSWMIDPFLGLIIGVLIGVGVWLLTKPRQRTDRGEP